LKTGQKFCRENDYLNTGQSGFQMVTVLEIKKAQKFLKEYKTIRSLCGISMVYIFKPGLFNQENGQETRQIVQGWFV
jgi:hypothetical protein